MRDECTSRVGSGAREDLPGPRHAPVGPAAALEAWYREHRDAVYRYVRYRVGSREAAEDVTSEVFLKVCRSLHRYDPHRAAPRTWLLRIARNAVTDHLRSRRRRASLLVPLERIPEPASDQPSPEEGAVRRERLRRLRAGGRTLRKPDREVLALRYAAGLSNGEIAERLGISSNAAAVRLHRARARLRSAVLRSAVLA